MPFSRVLAIGAHTDDIELGCGAFLNSLVNAGADVAALAFSRAEGSLPPEFARDTLEREFRTSMGLIGVTENVFVEGIPVRHFPAHRQEVLERLVSLNRSFRPDLVLTMSSTDTHQDHAVVHQESVRAFRGTTVLGYEIPWNQQQNLTNLYVEVSEEDIAMKARMLSAYESQVSLGRSYVADDFVRAAAVFRGFQSKKPLAEAFEVISMHWGRDFL